MIEPDWDNYANFFRPEFACSHCGRAEMQEVFMDNLQALRDEYGKGMTITSGFRCAQHPIEANKSKPGAHTTGMAADIAVQGKDAYELLALAFEHGFSGIGVQQKGDKRFIHLDLLAEADGYPRPWVWSY